MTTQKRSTHRPYRSGSGKAGVVVRSSQGSPRAPMGQDHVFDSKGPDLRMRGTAQQLVERYQELARDATLHGDRVDVEHYYQHAEHYLRTRNAMQEADIQTQDRHVVSTHQDGQLS